MTSDTTKAHQTDIEDQIAIQGACDGCIAEYYAGVDIADIDCAFCECVYLDKSPVQQD